MKVHLRMVGCRLNQSEIETMARQFQSLGHEIVERAEDADHFVLNTCAVTAEASKTSRRLIRDFHRRNPDGETTVTGCHAQIAADEIAALPGVSNVVSNLEKDQLVSYLTGESVSEFDIEPLARGDSPGVLGRARAFVKAQDGCDKSCTFCVTTIARGGGRSRPLADIVEEVNRLRQLGYQEAVLTGVHLGSYGHDFGDRDGLARLTRSLLDETDMPRLRLSSLEPWDLTQDFFELWQNPRLCRHLHLPLQSGCDATLKRMRRHTSQAEFQDLLRHAHAAIPHLRVTTDVIVGFPGESDAEFEISRDFIDEMNFGGLHVFRYSSRPGTPAARMRDQVPETMKKRRSAILLEMSAKMEERFAESLHGMDLDVLWEAVNGAAPAGFIQTGYTDNYMRVRAVHPRDLTNHIFPTRIGVYKDKMIRGKVIVANVDEAGIVLKAMA